MKSGGSTPGASSVDERAAALLLLLRSAPTTIISSSSSSSTRPIASSGFAVSVSSERVCYRRRGSVSASEEEEVPSPSCSSTSCSSSCVSDPSRSFAAVAEADPLLLLALAVRCVEQKPKAVRRTRSIVLYGSIGSKDMKDKWEEQQLHQGKQQSEEYPVASSVSGISTAAPLGDSISFPTSSISGPSPAPWSPEGAPLRNGRVGEYSTQPSPPSSPVSAASVDTSSSRGGGRQVVMRMRRVEGKYVVVGNSKVGGTGVWRRAIAIMEFLSERGCTSEVRIRAAIGDSPDTSKALRMLLKLDQVKRSGTGGRPDPFLYSVTGLEGVRTPRTSAQDGTGALVLHP